MFQAQEALNSEIDNNLEIDSHHFLNYALSLRNPDNLQEAFPLESCTFCSLPSADLASGSCRELSKVENKPDMS